jgi:hypothetical protein
VTVGTQKKRVVVTNYIVGWVKPVYGRAINKATIPKVVLYSG